MSPYKFDVLVIGGTGFIGEYLVAKLVRLKFKIAVFHSGFYEPLANPAVQYFKDDANGHIMEELVSCSKDIVYLAPPISGLLDRFLASVSSDLTRTVLYASTVLLYKGGAIPEKENGLLLPLTSYAKEKYSEEEKILSFSSQNPKIKVIIARLGNVYGDVKNRGLIQQVFQSFFITDKSDGVVISGEGKQIRDFIFINDVAEALTLLLDSPKVSTGVVNVTTGVGHSLLEVIKLIEKITGKKIIYRFGPPVSETFSIIGDNSKLKSLIERTPRTDLETGLRETYKRYIMNFKK